MKGQYFSFDAVVATVIMAIAMTSLAAYWSGTRSVVDSRASPLYEDALRIADSLLSPGVPAGWERGPVEEVQQFGLANDFGNTLNTSKIDSFNSDARDHYNETGRIMRATADYFVWIEQTNPPVPYQPEHPAFYQAGKTIPANATEVVVAYRGVVLQFPDGTRYPARMRVFLWR